MTEDDGLEAIAKIGRELVTKEDVAAVGVSMQMLLQDIEKLLEKMNRELATKEDVAAVRRRMAFFYDGMLAGAVLGLAIVVVFLVVALVFR